MIIQKITQELSLSPAIFPDSPCVGEDIAELALQEFVHFYYLPFMPVRKAITEKDGCLLYNV